MRDMRERAWGMTARTWWATGLAAASIAMLGACSDEAIVASDPVLGTPAATTVADAPAASTTKDAPDAADETGQDQAEPQQPEPTESQERVAEPAADPLDEYLAAVDAAGLPAGPEASSARGIGAYVCAASADALPRESILINVTAMVGLELQRIGSDEDPERIANEYVDTAGRHYCDG